MSDLVWRDDEVIISTYIGPIRGARGPRTRVQIVLATPTHGNAIMSLDLVQWESLCNAVRELGTNPHHAPPVEQHAVTPSPRALAARDEWIARNGGEDAIKRRMTHPLLGSD